jgi:AraC-like DNA-binding protein
MRVEIKFFTMLFLFTQIHYAQDVHFKDFVVPDSILNFSQDDIYELYKNVAPHHSNDGVKSIISSRVFAKSFIVKSIESKDSLSIGKGYLMLGRLSPVDTIYLNKSISYTKSLKSNDYPSLPYMTKFLYYFERGDYRKANRAILAAKEYHNGVSNIFFIKSCINKLNAKWGDCVHGIHGLFEEQKIIRTKDFNEIQQILYFGDVKNELLTDNFYCIAESFYRLHDYKMAAIYLDSVQLYGKKYDFPETIDNYNGLKGAILYKQGSYAKALTYTNAYLNNSIENDDYGISRSCVIKGLSFWGLGEKDLAVFSLIKADSLYQRTQDEFEELGDGYKALIAYYQEQGDKDKQLEYLNKLIMFDEEINANYLEIAPAITRSYTIPELLSEKEEIIQELSVSNQLNKHKKTIYYVLLMIASVVISYFVVQRILFKRRFDKIKNRLELSENRGLKNTKNVGAQELFDLDAKQIERIAKGLERFELEKGYVNTRLSLKYLATSIDTNSSYLSKYINAIKGVNFSNYVNTLRIHAIIEVLQVDSKIRSYTIDAIAEEAGFSNTRSFSNHFKRVTGINTSYFLKQLQKELDANEAQAPQTV